MNDADRRHAYEVCAQIAEKHKGCSERHYSEEELAAGARNVEFQEGRAELGLPPCGRTCVELIAEEIRCAQGSRKPSPRCLREWESQDGNRVFTCPRRKGHRGMCGDNTNKRRYEAEGWREVVR